MMATSSSRTVQIDSFALDAIEKLAVWDWGPQCHFGKLTG
jgi:hypothetical protein